MISFPWFAEFGIVWGSALFHKHEGFNAKETTQEKSSQSENYMRIEEEP